METQLTISGMTCEMCVKHVTHALEGVAGVQSANVDLQTGSAVVQHNHASLEAMLEAVTEEGYEASVKSG